MYNVSCIVATITRPCTAQTLLSSYTSSLRLTAFVLRSFVRAQTFVYIDDTVIEHSKTWLEGRQKINGCFQQSGKLFNNRMKVRSKLSFT